MKDKPVFPVRRNDGLTSTLYKGLTKREYFAAKAMQGLISMERTMDIIVTGNSFDSTAEVAVGMADALIKELGND